MIFLPGLLFGRLTIGMAKEILHGMLNSDVHGAFLGGGQSRNSSSLHRQDAQGMDERQ